MPVKKHFINRGLQSMLIEEYLGGLLDNAGYAGIDLQKTPMGTRITIKTARPGLVIGRRGKKVKELTDEIKERFNINVPTIDVDTVQVPELNAQIQSERIAFAIQKGQNYRRATYGIIRRIIRAGARGVEVRIAGKVTSQRARVQVFRAGVISKCGMPALEGVDRGISHSIQKSGVLGIQVKIMPLSYKMPDEVIIRDTPKFDKKSSHQVDEFYTEVEEEEEIVDVDEEEEELFDDVSDAEETVLKNDEETLEATELIDQISEEDTDDSEKKKD